MSDAPVEVSFADGVGRITFNRPEAMNAADVATAVAFRDSVRALAAKPGLRVIVIAGAGRAFMAGGDLASFRKARDRSGFAHELIAPIHEGLALLSECRAVSIAAVQGVAAHRRRPPQRAASGIGQRHCAALSRPVRHQSDGGSFSHPLRMEGSRSAICSTVTR